MLLEKLADYAIHEQTSRLPDEVWHHTKRCVIDWTASLLPGMLCAPATVLIEAMLLAVGGGLVGWLLGHLLVGAIGPWISTNAGVSASVFSAVPLAEALLVPFLILLAIAAALLPAIAAYRTDVSKWLQGPG